MKYDLYQQISASPDSNSGLVVGTDTTITHWAYKLEVYYTVMSLPQIDWLEKEIERLQKLKEAGITEVYLID